LREEDIGRISTLENQFHTLNDQLDTRFTTLNAKFETLIDVLASSRRAPEKKGKSCGRGKGGGRGKNSLNHPQYAQSAQSHGREFYGYDGSLPGSSRQLPVVESRSSDIFTEDESLPPRSLRHESLRNESLRNESLRNDSIRNGHGRRLAATKRVHLTKIQCLLNNAPIDMVEDFQTEDECMQAYWRMFTFNSQMNSLFTNGISYDEFR
jgi:hypothetical protein